jgi:hypothetical protein
MRNTVFWELDLFPPKGEGRETPVLWTTGWLLKRYLTVVVALPSPEDRNRSGCKNVVL